MYELLIGVNMLKYVGNRTEVFFHGSVHNNYDNAHVYDDVLGINEYHFLVCKGFFTILKCTQGDGIKTSLKIGMECGLCRFSVNFKLWSLRFSWILMFI